MSLIKENGSILTLKNKGKAVRFALSFDLKNLFLSVVNEKDSHLYDEFVCKIRDMGQEIPDDDLIQILKEARSCISMLDRNVRLFVQVILLLKWSHRSEETVAEYQGFLSDLCSAHSYYTQNVIDNLVSHFKYGSFDYLNGEPKDDEKLPFLNIHCVVRKILNVIPMSRDILISTITSSSPYIKRPYNEHVCYVYNVLQIITYAPTFRLELLKIIMQKIISIDVILPKGDSEFKLTLDHCLNIFLTFIKNQCFDGECLNFQNTKILYTDLIKVFECLLLTAHGTNYAQFVIFYILSVKPILTVGWLQMLWGKVCNPNVAPIVRQTSVSYIASLLSRGAYVSLTLVKDMLNEMTSFIHSYIASQESVTKVVQDTRIHGVFYSICQGVFYVIAFRHKELIDSKKGLTFLESLNLTKIVQSRLNPLKSCDPVVARNFASVTRAYQLVYCYSILERNSRSSIPQLSKDYSGNETIVQPYLDTFFPFDPFNLPVSSKFVKPIYREYEDFILSEEEPMQQDEDDDFLESTLSESPRKSIAILSQSPQTMSNILYSQSPRQSITNFLYTNHPGFLHIT